MLVPGESRKPASGHLASHGAGVVKVGLVSLLGIAASFGFQIVTARSLGLAEFGVLSSFFAIVSMAAIGSSALQNAVAVQTARAIALDTPAAPARRLDGFTIEALVLGGAGTLLVVIGTPWISEALRTEYYVPLLAAISVLLSFIFARAVGSIQGVGDSQGAVWWSSISLILRFLLVALAFLAGLGLSGALVSVLLGSLLAMVGAGVQASRLRLRIAHRPFQAVGVVVLLMTVIFAWMTNVDVILVRAGASGEVAGLYAAAAVLVKSAFLVPATLSLYLLPRFVRQENDRAMTKLGVRVTLAVTAIGGLVMIAFFAVAGEWVTMFLFGSQYDIDSALLIGLSVAYLPWIMAQGLLIRMSALSSKLALLVLAIAAIALWVAGSLVLPDIYALLVVIGALGVVMLGSFFVVDVVRSRSPAQPR